MKKIIAITAVVLVIIMSLTAFVACDKKGEEQEITADTKFEDIVSDKITEEELISMVQDSKNVDNFRIEFCGDNNRVQLSIEVCGEKMKSVNNTYDLIAETGTPVAILGATAVYTYVYYEDDILYKMFSFDNKNWRKVTGSDWDFYNYYAPYLEGFYAYYRQLDGAEGVGVKWSDEYKAYVYGDGDGNDWVYKFKNNRLCAFAIYDKDDKSDDMSFIYYDFGKVPEITIPEITE